MNIENLIRQKQGTIVDVRTPEEFSGGHVEGSVNIPLQDLRERMEEVKKLRQPLVLCCASGGRSGVAHQLLSSLQIQCYNAGPWTDVDYYASLT